MHFGACFFPTAYAISPLELGPALEERGFESLWAPEHSHIPVDTKSSFPLWDAIPKKYYDVMDPFVTLSTAAAVTTRLKVGTGICLVVQRDPIQTAKSVASLDRVSDGRLLFGVGGHLLVPVILAWNVPMALLLPFALFPITASVINDLRLSNLVEPCGAA